MNEFLKCTNDFIYLFLSLHLYTVVVKCKYSESNNICKLSDNGEKTLNVCKYT